MLVCAVTIRGVTQIYFTVSGLCVVISVVVGGGFIVVCRCVYSTYQHETIISRIRQLLMMGTWLPKTC